MEWEWFVYFIISFGICFALFSIIVRVCYYKGYLKRKRKDEEWDNVTR